MLLRSTNNLSHYRTTHGNEQYTTSMYSLFPMT